MKFRMTAESAVAVEHENALILIEDFPAGAGSAQVQDRHRRAGDVSRRASTYHA